MIQQYSNINIIHNQCSTSKHELQSFSRYLQSKRKLLISATKERAVPGGKLLTPLDESVSLLCEHPVWICRIARSTRANSAVYNLCTREHYMRMHTSRTCTHGILMYLNIGTTELWIYRSETNSLEYELILQKNSE